MIRLSTLVFVLCLSGNVASAKVEDMDRKRYGNCSVHIKNDGKDLTDVLGIAIYCYDDGGDRINASLLLYCWSERYLTSRQSPPFEKALVVLYAGTEFYLEETQLVKYRFDSGEIQSGEWIYTYSVARNYTAITFNEFAAGLRTAEIGLIFKIGNKTSGIPLSSSTEAMKDFDKRCEQLKRSK